MISLDEPKKEHDMLRSLFTAATGMTAQQQHIDIISNNLANVNTTGFKRGRADFQDLLYQTLRQIIASRRTCSLMRVWSIPVAVSWQTNSGRACSVAPWI